MGGGARYQATQAIEVEQDWNAQVARRIDDRAEYYEDIRRYDLSKLPEPAIANLVDYFLTIEKTADALRAGRMLLVDRPRPPDRLLLSVADEMGEILVPKRHGSGVSRDPEQALEFYAAAEAKARDTRAKAEMALAQGQVFFEELRALEQARSAWQKVLQEYRRPANSLEARRAYIGLGSLERWQGNSAAARQWYEKAQAIAVDEDPVEKLIVQRSAWARAVEDAFVRNDPEVTALAWQELATWAWHYPEDLLEGHHTVLLARLLLQQEEARRAADELEALLRANPESQYADLALWTLADCYLALKDRERALAALDRLQKDYPTSGLIPGLADRRQEVESARLR
jgi:tetratricopeptide (TPR) repeat protein